MKLALIFGAGAVGKMTVGQELAKITELRLYHNRIAIEPALEAFGAFAAGAIVRIREAMFEEFAKTDLYGMIFTFMRDFGVGAIGTTWSASQRASAESARRSARSSSSRPRRSASSGAAPGTA